MLFRCRTIANLFATPSTEDGSALTFQANWHDPSGQSPPPSAPYRITLTLSPPDPADPRAASQSVACCATTETDPPPAVREALENYAKDAKRPFDDWSDFP